MSNFMRNDARSPASYAKVDNLLAANHPNAAVAAAFVGNYHPDPISRVWRLKELQP